MELRNSMTKSKSPVAMACLEDIYGEAGLPACRPFFGLPGNQPVAHEEKRFSGLRRRVRSRLERDSLLSEVALQADIFAEERDKVNIS